MQLFNNKCELGLLRKTYTSTQPQCGHDYRRHKYANITEKYVGIIDDIDRRWNGVHIEDIG